MKRFVSVFVLIGALAFVFGAGRVMAQGMNYSGNLSGAEEVPGPGDPDGTGTATATMDMAAGQACVTLKVSNITLPAAAAHIHEGARGVAGPVVVPLTAPDANGMSEGCVAVAADLMSRITANPSNFYFNVHTSDYPQGAVRGQVMGMAMAPAPLPATGVVTDLAVLAALALLTMVLGLGARLAGRRSPH